MILRRFFTALLPFACVFVWEASAAATQHSTESAEPTTTEANSQAKRDISLSYSATDIDSKEGSRFKTITVIKNLNKDGSSEKLGINPELHKSEHWADAFRDNFDSYGSIPDVPDIDDLFEFMNKKPKAKPNAKGENKTEKSLTSMEFHARKPLKGRTEEVEKPVVEPPIESFGVDMPKAVVRSGSAMPAQKTMQKTMQQKTQTQKPSTMMMSAATVSNRSHTDPKNGSQRSAPTVEKITGDAELIPAAVNGQKRQGSSAGARSGGSGSGSKRSQSLSSLNKERAFERLINVNYSTPQHAVHQYFENYVQENTKGYDYGVPCANSPSSSVNVATSSGRTYDIPRSNSASNNANLNPYIAPSVARKPPSTTQPQPQPSVQVNPLQRFPPYSPQQPTYSVNSIVPPLASGGLQPNPNFGAQVQPQRVPQQPTTSQRPYLAPNIRNGLGYNRGAPPSSLYGGPTISPIYRTNIFGINKSNAGRSRGLKY